MNILQRALSTHDVSAVPAPVAVADDDDDYYPARDDESDSTSATADSATDVSAKHSQDSEQSASVPLPSVPLPSSVHNKEDTDSAARAWYDFDLAIVVALVSPIGNWFTGGDHVKNILLLLLLIFYLHQIIEIPWALYNAARSRRAVLPPLTDNSPRAQQQRAAAAELRIHELGLLALTVISPLLGATLLRVVAGAAVISWFSTALFVLATGVRPWTHLAQRLSARTAALHSAVHAPGAHEDALRIAHEALTRVAALERALADVRRDAARARDEAGAYIDEALDGLEHTVRRQARRADKTDAHIATLASVVEALRTRKGKEREGAVPAPTAVTALARACAAWVWPASPSPPPERGSMRRGASFRLETIPEEGVAAYSAAVPPPYPPLPRAGRILLERALLVLTFPLRTVVWLLSR